MLRIPARMPMAAGKLAIGTHSVKPTRFQPDCTRPPSALGLSSGDVGAEPAEALIAILAELVGGQANQPAHLIPERPIEATRRVVVVLMGAAGWFLDDAVDHAELEQVRRGDLQALGRLGRLIRALPEDGRAALWRDDRVVAELQHEHAVGHTERERAAGAAFTDHRADDRH